MFIIIFIYNYYLFLLYIILLYIVKVNHFAAQDLTQVH